MKFTFSVDELELKADFVFPGLYFDVVYRKENAIPTPLLGDTGPQYDMSGCYLWFDFDDFESIRYLYVGRSMKLRNRLTGHWGNYYKGHVYNPISNWFDHCFENDIDTVLFAAIFLLQPKSSQDLKDLEHLLMGLKPLLNVH